MRTVFVVRLLTPLVTAGLTSLVLVGCASGSPVAEEGNLPFRTAQPSTDASAGRLVPGQSILDVPVAPVPLDRPADSAVFCESLRQASALRPAATVAVSSDRSSIYLLSLWQAAAASPMPLRQSLVAHVRLADAAASGRLPYMLTSVEAAWRAPQVAAAVRKQCGKVVLFPPAEPPRDSPESTPSSAAAQAN